MKKRIDSRKIALLGLLTALALVLGYVDTLLPAPAPVPGVKLGLGNVVVLMALYLLGAKSAFALMLLKVGLTALLFGSVPSLCYSLAGGVASFCAMALAKRGGVFGVIGVSLCGAAAHNAGQIAAASVLMGSGAIWGYLPVLLVCGVLAGLLTGAAADRAIAAIEKMHK